MMQSFQSSQPEITLNEDQYRYIHQKYMSKCKHCKCVKPPRVHHCSKCDRCVLRMDHHCKWLSNCVGQRNIKFFLNFTFYMALYCLYSFVIFCKDGIQCLDKSNTDRTSCQVDKAFKFYGNTFVTIFSNAIGILVCCFCLCQFFYQLRLIKLNTSYVDHN